MDCQAHDDGDQTEGELPSRSKEEDSPREEIVEFEIGKSSYMFVSTNADRIVIMYMTFYLFHFRKMPTMFILVASA